MLVGWSCPPSIEEQDTEDGEEASAPWMEYYRTRHSHGGVYYSPDLDAIREEEAYSLLFAAFLLWDVSDDIMYLTTMAAWVVEAVCRKLPSFPTQTIENYQYTITQKKHGFVRPCGLTTNPFFLRVRNLDRLNPVRRANSARFTLSMSNCLPCSLFSSSRACVMISCRSLLFELFCISLLPTDVWRFQ